MISAEIVILPDGAAASTVFGPERCFSRFAPMRRRSAGRLPPAT